MSRFLGIHCPRRCPKRMLLFITMFLIIIWLVKKAGNSIDNDEEWYKHPFVHFSAVTCHHDQFTMQQFDELTEKMVSLLEKLNLRYFLCYGSLWGALKFQKTLPWDRNIDFCVIYHQLVAIDEQNLHSAFKAAGLNYYYNSRRGKYIVSHKTVSGEITIFEKVGEHMERVGWEKRIFPHLYINYQNFPYQLIDKELPRIKFNNQEVPAPHQEYELQKYLYPDNWWKEVKPKSCL